ncbi:MAG: energy transducer TonB [Bacteroidia bacterium]
MIILENNAALLNDIVFKSRNKSYGAYVIRSEYGNTILKSLGVTVLFFASISILAIWLNNTVAEDKKIDIDGNIVPIVEAYKVIEVVMPPLKKEVTPVATPPAASNVNTTAVSTIINDHAVEQVTDPIQTNNGVTNGRTGNPDVIPGDVGGNNPPGGGEDPRIGATNEPVDVTKLDVMPSFDNMAGFLRKNLKYPTMAINENVSGRVLINFIVDEEGKIISATLLNHVGYGCDEEALRVVKLMPKWKPGMVKGKPVKVSFSLPIVFRLQ